MAATTATAYLLRASPWWKVLLAAYALGGTLSQNLFTAQHELSHCLAFRAPSWNRALAWASNCPLVIPMATAFKKYHAEHHSHLGVDGWDVDLPTTLEKEVVASAGPKTAWVAAYLAVYGLRPLIVRPKAPDAADLACAGLVLAFDAAVLHWWGARAFAYLAVGSLVGGGLHPMAGHLLAEHYRFREGACPAGRGEGAGGGAPPPPIITPDPAAIPGGTQETYSYYGPLNALTYNVGLHNEHHDFPAIPHSRLARLRRIAPEFYAAGLIHHASWVWVIWTFLADASLGPWSRVKRAERAPGAGNEVGGGGVRPEAVAAAAAAAKAKAAAAAAEEPPLVVADGAVTVCTAASSPTSAVRRAAKVAL